MPTREARNVIEHQLRPIPDSARISTAPAQFWIWAGANIAPINWVLGALGVGLGLSLSDTILVLVIGNLIGMGLFGLFVLMGQRTGVSQMVLSRAAFGRIGAYLPAAIQGLITVGWCAINTWIILDLVLALTRKLGFDGGRGFEITVALLIMAIQVGIAAIGFRAIAAFEKWTVPITVVVLIGMTIVAWNKTDIQWSWAGQHLHGAGRISAMSTIMTAIGIGWGITWFAYASDYSRFVPRSMARRKLFLASVLGQFIPVVWLGILGATLATVSQNTDPGQLIVGSFGALAVPVLLLVMHGPIATNVLNMYSCALCAQTVDWKIDRRKLTLGIGVIAAAFTIFLIYQTNFAATLDAWLGSMVTWVAPWAAIMLIHYWIFAKEQIDVDALFIEPKASPLKRIYWPAIWAFLGGIIATWAFSYGVPAFLQGPGAKALGNIDLSWLAGAAVAGAIYYLTGRPRQRHLRKGTLSGSAALTQPQPEPLGSSTHRDAL